MVIVPDAVLKFTLCICFMFECKIGCTGYSVKDIGELAFGYCVNLETLIIGESIEYDNLALVVKNFMVI